MFPVYGSQPFRFGQSPNRQAAPNRQVVPTATLFTASGSTATPSPPVSQNPITNPAHSQNAPEDPPVRQTNTTSRYLYQPLGVAEIKMYLQSADGNQNGSTTITEILDRKTVIENWLPQLPSHSAERLALIAERSVLDAIVMAGFQHFNTNGIHGSLEYRDINGEANDIDALDGGIFAPDGFVDNAEIENNVQRQINTEVQAIQSRENLRGRTLEFDAIVDARAVFNAEARNGVKNLDLLEGEYPVTGRPFSLLRHRLGVTDPAEKLQLDQQVLDLANTLSVYFTDRDMDTLYGMTNSQRDHLSLTEADFSSKVVIASSMVATLKNRPDLLADLLAGRRLGTNYPLKVVISTDTSQAGPNGFAATNNQLFTGNIALWTGLQDDGDGNENLTHEMIHLVDQISSSGADGMLPRMNFMLERRFRDARAELFDRFAREGFAGTNIRAYAFENNREFLSATMEIFLEDPQRLYNSSAALYEVYADYFNNNPLGVTLPPTRPPVER